MVETLADPAPTIFDQAEFDVRCEWGYQGVSHLAPISDVVVIVDVLSFSTCVEIATARGAVVFPYQGPREAAVSFAASVNAELAGRPGSNAKYALAPHTLLGIPAGTRLVLPSPNGSRLSLATGDTPTLTGCLRNYQSVARAASTFGRRVAVVPAGERWPDGSLRPALEDWLGAGAIIGHLRGGLSPEAQVALAAFRYAQGDIHGVIRHCSSGKELIARGFEENVRLAADVNASECVPLLVDGAYQRVELP